MAIIKKVDQQNFGKYILEDLGEKACLVKDTTLSELEGEVKRVCSFYSKGCSRKESCILTM